MSFFQTISTARTVYTHKNLRRTRTGPTAHAGSLSQIMEYLTITLHHLFCPHTRIAPRFTQRPAARAGSSNSLLSLSLCCCLTSTVVRK